MSQSINLRSFQLETNNYLKPAKKVWINGNLVNNSGLAYYSLDFYGWNKPNNPDYLNSIKNDFGNENYEDLLIDVINVISNSLIHIKDIIEKEHIDTVCLVPRSKKLDSYKNNQLFFKKAIKHIINIIQKHSIQIEDGSEYIIRYIDTKTTHFKKPEYAGSGQDPYPNITKDTCKIAPEVRNKNILLIDDIYTKTININEDCIQALLDNGANRVVLYTVAKTYYQPNNLSY